jgi:hypothetical protein
MVLEGPFDCRDGFDQKNPPRMPPGLLANGLEWLMLPRLVPEPVSRTVPERNLKDTDSLTFV